MQADYLIIGQGLCGTWLSYYLEEAGQSYIVIDEDKPDTASKTASGIINPVTGRRVVKTWMIDELLPFAWQAYQSFGELLGIDCIGRKPVVDFFTTPQMRLAFLDRYQTDQQFLSLPADENKWLPYLQYDFGYGIIQAALLVDTPLLLQAQRKKLVARGQLMSTRFDPLQLVIKETGVEYNNISAGRAVFCEGAAGFSNPFFPNLPYGLNKGEMMLVAIPGLPATHIIKKGYSLVPWTENIFWLGSTYLWTFQDEHPTSGFYQSAENWLKQTLKIPFSILEHRASVRPATLERKPFVGLHPVNNRLGILNGMGTKGCSLAPFFAQQLVNHLLQQAPILKEANVQRFKGILSR
ncbi:MAG: FAD-dependent oxidoreductase [Bacteroidota bacterium]